MSIDYRYFTYTEKLDKNIETRINDLIDEYHKQVSKIFKGTEIADLATTWRSEVSRIEDGFDLNSYINIMVTYSKFEKNNTIPYTRYYSYSFPAKALSEPKKYVYLKLKKEFGKKMRNLRSKIIEIDTEIENWNNNYTKFKELEDEVLSGEKEDER